MHKYYNFAGMVVRITGQDDQMPQSFGNLTDFQTAPQSFDWDYSFRIVDELSAPAGKCVFMDPGKYVYQSGSRFISYVGSIGDTLNAAYIRIDREPGRSCVEVKRSALRDRISSKTVINSLEAEHLIVMNDGILLHSSYVGLADGAILFTAPSGTGKSTQAELWRKYRNAEILNGDRSVVRIKDGSVVADGVPFSGSSGICKSRTLPLKAIVFLAQAPNTTIRSITGLRAFRLLWEGCTFHTWSREDTVRCSETLTKVLSEVPVFYLACKPDESAVIALEQAMESRNLI